MVSQEFYDDIEGWIKSGNNVNHRVRGLPVISLACEEELQTHALALIDAGCDVNRTDFITGDTPLHYALFYFPEVVRSLIANNANINHRNHEGYSPLEDANNFLCFPDPMASLTLIVESAIILINHGALLALKQNDKIADELHGAVLSEVDVCDEIWKCLRKRKIPDTISGMIISMNQNEANLRKIAELARTSKIL